MSNSLNPWILESLLSIAKEFGVKLFDVPPYRKKRKVQIIEFLTYPPKDQQNTFIWARISDMKHIATVKFTKQAVADCHESLTGMPRLTQHKGAIATISKFKPICSRFPLEQDRMSSEAFIIFECDYVEILGCTGEATFGQPKGIEQDPEISLWSKGIVQGAGLVIRQPFNIDDLDLTTYKARWHNRLRSIGPPIEDVIKPEEKEQKSEMQNTDLGGKEERSRSGTPISDWERSPRAKVRSESPFSMQVDEIAGEQEEHSSVLPSATPAQRGSLATGPPPSLSVVNETQINPDTRHLSMARKVPRPASPETLVEQIGTGRVLAPNSDTSQSQSQTMKSTQMLLLLGGNVVDTTGRLPWMSLGDVGRVMDVTAELRLRNQT